MISKSTQAEYADVAPRPAEAGCDVATRLERKRREGDQGGQGARGPGQQGTGTPAFTPGFVRLRSFRLVAHSIYRLGFPGDFAFQTAIG